MSRAKTPPSQPNAPALWRRRMLWGGAVLFTLVAFLAGAAHYFAERFEPYLREQTLDYLRNRFDGDVELGPFDVSMPMGDPVRVLLDKGKGAHIRVRVADITIRHKGRRDIPPLLLMNSLEFRLELPNLWETPIRIDYIKLAKLELTVPPKGQRPDLAGLSGPDRAAAPGAEHAEAARVPAQPDRANPMVLIDRVDMDGMRIVVLPGNPAKEPLEFQMKTLRLESAGPGVPMRYKTVMTNASPPGLVECTGTFGPFQAAEPGQSPVTGDYSFKGANLGVFKPIDGQLASTGRFEGRLNRIVVDGEADVPDFRLKSAGNVVPLKTKFHVIVDGTDGDAWLQPVMASLGSSYLICRGGIARNRDEAKKTINLDVSVNKGRIEDFLLLSMKGPEPPLHGGTRMKFRMRAPPGAGQLLSRMVLDGTFSLQEAGFTSSTVQEKIDEISRRTQGKPSAMEIQRVTSNFSGAFRFEKGVLDLSGLLFSIPGADVSLDGTYNLDSEEMDFHGVVRTRARVSQMVKTTWKRILLKPVDPFFAKEGAGAVIRLEITGTRSNPRFGRDRLKDTKRPRGPAAGTTRGAANLKSRPDSARN